MREYTIDAKNKHLGRLATEIALLLQGKDMPTYNPKDQGDVRVIVKNITDVKVTGKKADQKIYYHHTGFIGHMKEKTYTEAFTKDPKWVLRHAVQGMLPKNRLAAQRIKRLVFETEKTA